MNVDGIVTARENARRELRELLTPGSTALYAGWPVRVISRTGDFLKLVFLQECDVDDVAGHDPRRVRAGDRVSYFMPAACTGQGGGLIRVSNQEQQS